MKQKSWSDHLLHREDQTHPPLLPKMWLHRSCVQCTFQANLDVPEAKRLWGEYKGQLSPQCHLLSSQSHCTVHESRLSDGPSSFGVCSKSIERQVLSWGLKQLEQEMYGRHIGDIWHLLSDPSKLEIQHCSVFKASPSTAFLQTPCS